MPAGQACSALSPLPPPPCRAPAPSFSPLPAARYHHPRIFLPPCSSTNSSLLNTFTLDLHGQHVDEALASLER